MADNSANLRQQWREFLRRNPDARSIVLGIMNRTGFEEGDVLIYLLNAWRSLGYQRTDLAQFLSMRF